MLNLSEAFKGLRGSVGIHKGYIGVYWNGGNEMERKWKMNCKSSFAEIA